MKAHLLDGSEDHGRGFRRIVELLVWLVILPTVVLLVLGILMLVFWRAQLNLVFGILVVTLVACLVTGAVLLLVLLHREAQLSKLQMDFVSKVSHELRTPLTSIRMFVETLRKNLAPDDEKSGVCVDVLDKETARLSARIERLLDWGRMEAGRRTYLPQPSTVESLVNEALDALESFTFGATRQVTVELDAKLPVVMVDHDAMVDVLVNLLSNAHKYSPVENKIEISALTDGRSVRIAVRDRGVGIPRREHRNIFKKFYRVDERLSSEVEGSGLGLAIVRHVVQGHGGHIEVDSEPGRGSTFTIVIPQPRGSDSPGTLQPSKVS